MKKWRLASVGIVHNARSVGSIRPRERNERRREGSPGPGHFDLNAGWIDLSSGVHEGYIVRSVYQDSWFGSFKGRKSIPACRAILSRRYWSV